MTSTHEQWDIVSGVGLTALVVAAGRAVDTRRPDSLVTDPWAESFVRAAAPARSLPTRPDESSGDPEVDAWQMMSGYMGVRSRFFDEFVVAAGRDGVTQVVILASGLDTRGFRQDWAPGSVLYEVDQPAVLAFKDDVLDREGARARCVRRVVPVDLRDDWPGALEAAGLDPTRPSAWLAEGLLPYLPAPAQEALLDAVVARGAPGSRIAVEDFGPVVDQLDDPALVRISRHLGVNLADLVHTGPRPDPAARLAAHGWTTRTDVASEVAAGWGRAFDPLTERLHGRSRFITARR